MNDQMPEFMSGVESRASSIVLVRSQYNKRVVNKRNRECIYIWRAQRKSDYDGTMFLKQRDRVWNRPRLQAPGSADLCGQALHFRFVCERPSWQVRNCLQWDVALKTPRAHNVVSDTGESRGPPSIGDRRSTKRTEKSLGWQTDRQVEELLRNRQDLSKSLSSLGSRPRHA
jgi:hypothetical protein